MIKQVIAFAKKHWFVILAVLAIVIIGFILLGKKKERMYDYEIAGCSTCDAGDAGVLLDTEQEMYQMPDDYYSGDESAAPADSDQLVLLNPDETGAVVTDREDSLEAAVYDDSENSEYADMTFAEEVADDLEEDVVYDDSELDHVDENEVEEEENSFVAEDVAEGEDDLQLIPMDESYETDFMLL
ncbi:hypothetical protein PBCVNY2B_889L [Paramecium bursaria Chlorella virus NY2B]|uniref:Uncharacterized protein n=1 Tax=Paramecium bursaria Chlorella virus NYs1 TaxID=83442 RepID=M1HHZ6_9PHYC|nr:hypothetical protein AR158_C772L [Paramecium bursaria Chlorella virus AR158]YP_009665573.1 hypothetical protein FK949_gp197 [Paramecium bursaria Chlorella virus NYs1]AGE54431.1 hypothetical protein PBCVIL52s1_901L [Paramecium bursaria Chlorella virus IL-5-2s1]AGE55111.1 hypothetical protein PBCVMA1D_877L [Paramecium bursaria Chlorella virus MA1D]AGE58551.1 hypothetical protein PBCVNY2B_889L [Paramecium bursaria Chlorella virus NY2B]ABU44317.1 hypothetical protein AR158_C772L [Paramecium bur